jgi:hypothetical protein
MSKIVYPADVSTNIVLLTIRGTLAPETLEAARKLHNETAGAPSNVAAARSLGDLSHLVYVPMGNAESAKELLVVDLWNSVQGLDGFFANPQVREQAGRIFTKRDPVVWQPAADFASFHMPPLTGKGDLFVGLIRGPMTSRKAAIKAFDEATTKGMNDARRLGQLSHQMYTRSAPPGSPEADELLGVDVWMSAEGMREHYASTNGEEALQGVFKAAPSASVWQRPAGSWVEW